MTRTRVLITGVGGFIGSHTVQWIIEYTDWEVIGLDTWHPKHKGDKTRLGLQVYAHIQTGRLKVYRVDLSVPISKVMENMILEREIVNGKIVEKPIDYIINMASDSHVTRSVTDPEHCWLNNTQLILNMLEFARKNPVKSFIQVSTDEVYGDAGWTGAGHPEWDTIKPSNPYSASKAAQEALAFSYWRTYDMPIVITNTMNVIGERQDPEKFLPMCLSRIMTGKVINLHSDSEKRVASRVWLDAKNMAAALLWILRNTKPAMYEQGRGVELPDRYNIVGDVEMNVLDLANMIANMVEKQAVVKLVRGDDDRPGYDRRYALDGSKLKDLGFRYPFTFEDTISRVVSWTLKHHEWLIT